MPETLVLHRTHGGNTPTIWEEDASPWLDVNRKHLAEIEAAPRDREDRLARANLLMNMALGEYWRRNLAASRRWMWRALLANPRILEDPGHYVWCAPLLHALLPHPLADRVIGFTAADRYITPEGLAA